MKVLVLGPNLDRIAPALAGCKIATCQEPLDGAAYEADWLVSFGYRHIISEPFLSWFNRRIINIHISLLPWNRGADPNFWSWLDGTPKGVTIHQIDKGIDTGPILAQRVVEFGHGHTLRTSYAALMDAAADLFQKTWPQIRAGMQPMQQASGGSYHRSADKEPYSFDYDTPVSQIEAMGATRLRA